MPETKGIKAFVALRDRPTEQKIDAVLGLYPLYVWDEALSVRDNWLSAVALDQGCGTDDVAWMAKAQAKWRGPAGRSMRAWLQMLKEAK